MADLAGYAALTGLQIFLEERVTMGERLRREPLACDRDPKRAAALRPSGRTSPFVTITLRPASFSRLDMDEVLKLIEGQAVFWTPILRFYGFDRFVEGPRGECRLNSF